jgi:hypothetical protein
VTADGYAFDSIRESERYQELKLLEKAGEIRTLKVHPTIKLQPAFMYRGTRIKEISYESDFYYVEEHDGIGIDVYEDVKGFETPVFKLKWKLLLFQYRLAPVEFRIVR